jgi:hypothetical protein
MYLRGKTPSSIASIKPKPNHIQILPKIERIDSKSYVDEIKPLNKLARRKKLELRGNGRRRNGRKIMPTMICSAKRTWRPQAIRREKMDGRMILCSDTSGSERLKN